MVVRFGIIAKIAKFDRNMQIIRKEYYVWNVNYVIDVSYVAHVHINNISHINYISQIKYIYHISIISFATESSILRPMIRSAAARTCGRALATATASSATANMGRSLRLSP